MYFTLCSYFIQDKYPSHNQLASIKGTTAPTGGGAPQFGNLGDICFVTVFKIRLKNVMLSAKIIAYNSQEKRSTYENNPTRIHTELLNQGLSTFSIPRAKFTLVYRLRLQADIYSIYFFSGLSSLLRFSSTIQVFVITYN
jgi:hypothetical protein